MSNEIEMQEVGRGGCRGGGYVIQPCAQQYYQDWRCAQPRFQPDARICQPYGQPVFYGQPNDGSCTGPYWDRARVSENENQLQYWGAKREENLVRDARGKVIDADYGDGNWAHSPHDSNSVTVHRHGKTEHWVQQQNGTWWDQINRRSLNNRDVNYDPRTGKLVIEGETYDPKKKPEEVEVLPPPEVEERKITKQQLLTELSKSPFDANRLYHLMDGMSSQEKLALMRETTREADAAVRGAGAEATGAQELKRRANVLLGRTVLPEIISTGFNADQLKGLMQGMTVAERFNAMGEAIKYSDGMVSRRQLEADFTNQGSPEKLSAKTRGAMGFMCADLAKEYEAQKAQTTDAARQQKLNELAGTCKWRAVDWFLSAGHLDSSLYNDEATGGFRQSVLNCGLPGASGDFILQKGKESSNWFFPTQQEISANPNAFQDAYERARAQIGEAMRRQRTEAAPQPQPQPNPDDWNDDDFGG